MSPAHDKAKAARSLERSSKKAADTALVPAGDAALATEALADLSPTELYRDKGVFIMGATGFVGKVALSMLLANFPEVRRVYVMVRAGSGTSPQERFDSSILPSPAFDPLRERYGAATEEFVRSKVVVVGGDITDQDLGYTPERAQEIADDIDVIINSSGRVTFNPPLDSSLRTNVGGTQNVLDFVKRMKRPALVHLSTCFVAGNRSGEVWEDEELHGYFPKRDDFEDTEFDIAKEVEDCARLSERVRVEANEAIQTAEFKKEARDRLIEDSRDPDNPRTLKLMTARIRKEWVRERLTELGIERAQRWGWPNIYTFTKSMGDQMVAAEEGIIRSIIRPSIVESADAFPFPGWNEGFTTTAPIIFLSLKGANLFPAHPNVILDVTPVDFIAGGTLLVAAQAMVEQPALVHQLATSQINPTKLTRLVSIMGLNKRKEFRERDTGNKFVNELVARMDSRAVTYDEFNKKSIPAMNRGAKRVQKLLDRVRPSWGGGRITETVDRIRDHVDRFEELTATTVEQFEIFRPFINDNEYIFRADNIVKLYERVRPEERSLVPWYPEELDWYDWWLNAHLPGLKKWVFPDLEEGFKQVKRGVYTYRDLVELFDTTAKIHRTRIAMRFQPEDEKATVEQYTYGELHELASRGGGYLASAGVSKGDRVALWSDNRPEWGMAYFGVLKAGATCVPLDRDATEDEVVNLCRAGEVKGLLISDELADKHPDVEARLKKLGISLWCFDEVFALGDEAEENERNTKLVAKASGDSVASLIFTSGTTGTPKGVMLTHRNLSQMVSKLADVFELGTHDGLLSVLPLHHTFEFSSGFLVPLSRGARITYLEELNGDAIGRALKAGQVSAIVGVPALWDLLRRRVFQKFADRSPFLERIVKLGVSASDMLLERTGINLGRLAFLPVHEGFGGRLRYLVSGGSALSSQVLRAFRGLGFSMYEGYGLTESSPVLTVMRPSSKVLTGSVGKALPGIEVKISEPDGTGVGEVIAKGHNIMAGYYNNPEATAKTVRDGWLHTGDLGYFDEDNNLYLVGRSKDLIVDANGKNVYPDELEELYEDCPYIKELSIVGLPDGKGEKVACLAVPDYEHDESLSRHDVQEKVTEHIRRISNGLPFYKRIKVLHLWDADLPRTATKKVKRPLVVEELKRLTEVVDSVRTTRPAGAATKGDDAGWLIDIVAQVSNQAKKSVTAATRLDGLGFDSLMFTELGVAIEAAGGAIPSMDELTQIETVGALARFVRKGSADAQKSKRTSEADHEDSDEINVPDWVATAGRRGVRAMQQSVYRRLMNTEVVGASHIPPHTNFIVAPNHQSHLDMGLVKYALGDHGRGLCAVAASDYFFDDRYKRAYFENFTNLVPMDRSGSVRRSLEHAESLLRDGNNLLLFPEGTRSPSGEMTDFKPSLGWLALHAGVGILPMYLRGTYDALPKGSVLIKQRELGALIGPYLEIDFLRGLAEGHSRAESNRIITAYVQQIVEALRDGYAVRLHLDRAREAWTPEGFRHEVVSNRPSGATSPDESRAS